MRMTRARPGRCQMLPRSVYAVIAATCRLSVMVSSVGAAALAATVLELSGGRLGSGDWMQVGSLCTVVLVYYAVNTVPVSAIGALVGGGSIWRSVLDNARSNAPAECALALL